MGGFKKPTEYIKKTWDLSFYRPKSMANASLSVNQELSRTCNNLRELSRTLNNISSIANSSAYSSHVRTLISEVGTMNSDLSRTASKAVQDLLRVCNTIATKDLKLANEMKGVQKQMLGDLAIVEKYHNDNNLEV